MGIPKYTRIRRIHQRIQISNKLIKERSPRGWRMGTRSGTQRGNHGQRRIISVLNNVTLHAIIYIFSLLTTEPLESRKLYTPLTKTSVKYSCAAVPPIITSLVLSGSFLSFTFEKIKTPGQHTLLWYKNILGSSDYRQDHSLKVYPGRWHRAQSACIWKFTPALSFVN